MKQYCYLKIDQVYDSQQFPFLWQIYRYNYGKKLVYFIASIQKVKYIVFEKV